MTCLILCGTLGVISTMVSYVCKTATGRFHPSLGAVKQFTYIYYFNKEKDWLILTQDCALSTVRCCHGRPRCSLCKSTRSQVRNNLPSHVHIQCWKCKSKKKRNLLEQMYRNIWSLHLFFFFFYSSTSLHSHAAL